MTIKRVVAGIGGTIALLGAALVTFGAVLLAPLGMWIADRVTRRRLGTLTLASSWFGAVVTVTVVLALVGVVAFARSPVINSPATRHIVDSVRTAERQKPPPAWMERIAPGSTSRRNMAIEEKLNESPAFMNVMTVVGGLLLVEFIAVIVGTFGWGAGLLLAYAARGTWIGGRGQRIEVHGS